MRTKYIGSDLNSPILGYRGDVDANQAEYLIPEGEFPVKVYFSDAGPGSRWSQRVANFGHRRVPYFEAHVTAQVVSGEYKGWVAPIEISTLGLESGKECSMLCLLRALNVPVVSRRVRVRTAVSLVESHLANEPECVASVVWVATEWDDSRRSAVVRCRRMHRFPKDTRGNHIPELLTKAGALVRAKNTVRAWRPVGSGCREAQPVHRTNAHGCPVTDEDCDAGGLEAGAIESRLFRSEPYAERAVRAIIKQHSGRPLSGDEWACQKRRLIEFAETLKRWDREDRIRCQRGESIQ